MKRRFALALPLLAITLAVSFLATGNVSAVPPPSAQPIPLSQYGVVTVSANMTTVGGSSTITIRIVCDQNDPFFLDKLIIVLKPAADGDLVLDSMNIAGTGTIIFSSFGMPSPKVVVVPAGIMVGEVLTALPSYAEPILVKEPMGNNAIPANGADGITLNLHFATQSYSITVWAFAIVTAPSSDHVTIAMS
jgi:hypothetical protein